MAAALERSPRVSNHKKLYKGQTPPWKETYRKRCSDRLKKSRDKFLLRFRTTGDAETSVVQDVMNQEWKILQSEEKNLSSLGGDIDDIEIDGVEDGTIDEILTLFEEVRKDLLREEQEILREYEAGLAFDEQSLCAAIECLNAADVICPICTKNPLMLNKNIVFCKCGLRIDTEQDCVTLNNIQRNLREAGTMHGDICNQVPAFTVVNQFGVDNLLMSCQACDFMYIIV